MFYVEMVALRGAYIVAVCVLLHYLKKEFKNSSDREREKEHTDTIVGYPVVFKRFLNELPLALPNSKF